MFFLFTVQRYDVYFWPRTKPERQQCSSDAKTDMQPPSVFRVEPSPFGVEQA